MSIRCLAAPLSLIVACALLSGGVARADDELTLEALMGQWSYDSGKRAGEEIPSERLVGTVTISEESFTVPAGPDDEFVMPFELDTAASPAAIDFEIKSGPVSGATAVGIIKMMDGKIVLCYDPTGVSRPETFESTAENGTFLFVLKRNSD